MCIRIHVCIFFEDRHEGKTLSSLVLNVAYATIDCLEVTPYLRIQKRQKKNKKTQPNGLSPYSVRPAMGLSLQPSCRP